jgi:hypothetical protein
MEANGGAHAANEKLGVSGMSRANGRMFRDFEILFQGMKAFAVNRVFAGAVNLDGEGCPGSCSGGADCGVKRAPGSHIRWGRQDNRLGKSAHLQGADYC